MADHVVGHYSSSVRPTYRDWGSPRVIDIPAHVARGIVAELTAAPAQPLRLWRVEPTPDPADWRFREDGY